MSKDLNVLVDVSGSMGEDCKDAVIKYLINTILSSNRFEKYYLYLINDTVTKIDDISKAKIKYEKHISQNAIKDFYDSVIDNEPVLFISDGCFEADIENTLSKHKSNMVCVAVGSDAIKGNLQRCSHNKKVYNAEDVTEAMASFI